MTEELKTAMDTPRSGEDFVPARIVIGQRGWVWVGRYTEEFDEVTVTGARNIRRWGTSGGLGQLAQEGPQPATVLDPAGVVRLHRLAVVATLDAKESVWASHLG